MQGKDGVDAAPSALIAAGLLTQLQHDLGYRLFHDDTVHSYASLMPASDPDYRNMKRPLAVSAVTKRISEQVYSHARQGRFVLTLGGDHSIAIGTVAGTAQAIRERLGREMAVIWVDAHADINTPEASQSGNIHGMPVAFLTGLAEEKREDVFGWLRPEQKISVRKLVYIGLRDVDRLEKDILRENGIKAFSMHDIDRYVGPAARPGALRLRNVTLPSADPPAGMALAGSWRWPWLTSGTTPPYIYRLMSTRWIRNGRRAPAHLSEGV